MDTPCALVVDDEVQMLSIVAFALETQGFTCLTASNAASAWATLTKNKVDLVVLDVMMPHGSGMDLARKIRANSSRLPIIFLTALSDEDHRIAGLEVGADDYVTKPFSPRELALRARAIMRRSATSTDQAPSVKLGDLSVDVDRLSAYWDGKLLHLGPSEVRLLSVLAKNAGEIVSHRTILNEAWGTSETAGGREMIKTAVYRLRRNLAGEGIHSLSVHSHRGEGYSLQHEPEQHEPEQHQPEK